MVQVEAALLRAWARVDGHRRRRGRSCARRCRREPGRPRPGHARGRRGTRRRRRRDAARAAAGSPRAARDPRSPAAHRRHQPGHPRHRPHAGRAHHVRAAPGAARRDGHRPRGPGRRPARRATRRTHPRPRRRADHARGAGRRVAGRDQLGGRGRRRDARSRCSSAARSAPGEQADRAARPTRRDHHPPVRARRGAGPRRPRALVAHRADPRPRGRDDGGDRDDRPGPDRS